MSVPADRIAQQDPSDIILQYHEETKHHYYSFARSLGFLDWDNQPNPFRRFHGAPYSLPLLTISEIPSFVAIFQQGVTPHELSFGTLSRFFRNALAISAWKRAEDERWALRVNPSSGNLHPTEGYMILPETFPKLPAGVYHYAPREHALNSAQVLNPKSANRNYNTSLKIHFLWD